MDMPCSVSTAQECSTYDPELTFAPPDDDSGLASTDRQSIAPFGTARAPQTPFPGPLKRGL